MQKRAKAGRLQDRRNQTLARRKKVADSQVPVREADDVFNE